MKKMKMIMKMLVIFISLKYVNISWGQSVVYVGNGSYASYPKEADALNVANHEVYVVDEKKNLPKPTNDWWTDLLWSQYFGDLWAHPLVFSGYEKGCRIYFPKKWSGDANGAGMDKGFPLEIWGDNFTAKDARAKNWGDWTVQIAMYDNYNNGMDITIGHGLPYGWFEFRNNITPIIKSDWSVKYFTKENSTRKDYSTFFPYRGDNIIIEWTQGDEVKLFAIFAPPNTTFQLKSGTMDQIQVIFSSSAKYLIVTGAPNESSITTLYNYAYSIPRDSKVTYQYDRQAGKVNTQWTLTLENLKGGSGSTIQGWIPHHYRNTTHNLNFNGLEYLTARGKLKCATVSSWSISWKFNGIIPILPKPELMGINNDYDEARMAQYIKDYDRVYSGYGDDLYWGGKELHRYGFYMLLAYQLGLTNTAKSLQNKLRVALEDWLTYNPSEQYHYYAAYPIPAPNGKQGWGGVVPFVAGWAIYFTDHHLCLGYHYSAAAYLGMVDKDFLNKYKDILIFITKETANWDRNDNFFPFMRCFDIW